MLSLLPLRVKQIQEGNKSIIGIMLESHLNEGNQSSDLALDEMAYGVSVTDACINWDVTAEVLEKLASELKEPLLARNA